MTETCVSPDTNWYKDTIKCPPTFTAAVFTEIHMTIHYHIPIFPCIFILHTDIAQCVFETPGSWNWNFNYVNSFKNVTLTITNGLILYWKICANFLHVKSKVREKRWVIMNQSRDNNNNILEISSTGLSLFWPGQKRICNLALSLSHLFNWLSYEVVSKSLSSVTCTMPNAHSWSHSNGIKVSHRT